MSDPHPICQNLFTGTSVALVTPFTSEGAIDYDSLKRVVNNLIEARINQIVLFGTTGESPTISPSERRVTLRFMQEILDSTDIKLIVGFGGNNTDALCETLVKSDLDLVDGLLVSTPFYNKPSQEGLYRHYAAISEVSSLPLIVYNIPSRTGCDILPSTIKRLRESYPDRIVATKDSTGKIERIRELLRIMDPAFTVLSGDDCHTLEYMREGAHGAVSVVANAFPHLAKKIVDEACDTESHKRIDAMDDALSDLYKALFEDGNPAGIKQLLKEMKLIDSAHLRLPLVEVSPKVREDIVRAYNGLQHRGLTAYR